MASRDWFTDCSALFMRHSCHILSFALVCAAWYANRLENQIDTMQEAVQQIQIDVAAIRGRQSGPTPPSSGIAMAEAKE